jgi:hypothetical protein
VAEDLSDQAYSAAVAAPKHTAADQFVRGLEIEPVNVIV